MKSIYKITTALSIVIGLFFLVELSYAQSYTYGLSFKRNGYLGRVGLLNDSGKPFFTIGSDYPCGPSFAVSIEDIGDPTRGAFNIDGPFFWYKVGDDYVNPHYPDVVYPDEGLRSPAMISMRQTAQTRLKAIRITLSHQTRSVNNRSHEIALSGFKTHYPEYVREINLGPNKEAAQAINIEPLIMDAILATQQTILDQEKMLEDLDQLQESQEKLKTENESLKAIITEYQRKEAELEDRLKAIEEMLLVLKKGDGLGKSEESKPSEAIEESIDPIDEFQIGSTYPNPVERDSQITIPYQVPITTKDLSLIIFDPQGNLIYQQELNPIDKQVAVDLNVLNLISGHYICSLKIKQQVIGGLRVIVL